MERERTTKKRNQRRNQITKIAAKIFAEKGYHAASLEEVANQMDVTRASLYYHIKNKEELLEEICSRVMKSGIEESQAILSLDISPQEKLREYIRGQVVTSCERKELCVVIFEQANALNPSTYKKLQLQKKDFDQVLIDILQEGRDAGVFKIDDVRVASFVILGACFWTYHWYQPKGRLTPEQIADEMIKLLEKGYLA